MSDEERYIHLGPPPKDNVNSERYEAALGELRDFAERDLSDITSLESLSEVLMVPRRALRDVVVSVGTFDLLPETTISDPRRPGKKAITQLPGSYLYFAGEEGERISVSVNKKSVLEEDDYLLIIRSAQSEFDLRNPDERERVLEILKSFFPQIGGAIAEELRHYNVVSNIDRAVEEAVDERLLASFSDVGDLGEPPKVKLHMRSPEDVIQGVLRRIEKTVQRGLTVPVRRMDIDMPVTKDFTKCEKTEIGMFDCLKSVTVVNPLDHPSDPQVQQEFALAFQGVVCDLLPTFPEPFGKDSGAGVA